MKQEKDGKRFLDEWLEGTFLTSIFMDIWDPDVRYGEAANFLESMEKEFSKRIDSADEKTSYQFYIKYNQ